MRKENKKPRNFWKWIIKNPLYYIIAYIWLNHVIWIGNADSFLLIIGNAVVILITLLIPFAIYKSIYNAIKHDK